MLIYKYELNSELVGEVQIIQIPVCSRIIDAGFQSTEKSNPSHYLSESNSWMGNKLVVWAEVKKMYLEELEKKRFFIAFTGHQFELPNSIEWRFIRSLMNGPLVYHLYSDCV